MGTPDTQDLSSGYLAYLKKAASGVPSNFCYHYRHVSEVHFYSSQHESSNTKSVFCWSLSQPGPVFHAFAYKVRCSLQCWFLLGLLIVTHNLILMFIYLFIFFCFRRLVPWTV